MSNLIAEFGCAGLLSPELEKLGLLGDGDRSQRRPGDVSFKCWSANKGLALDVAVICPVAVSHLQEVDPCEEYARLHKHARYDESFKNSNYEFAAVIFETSGAVNEEGLYILKQILRCASHRAKMGHSSYASRAWARLSCCLQSSVAQMILNREYDDCAGVGVGV